MNVMKTVRTGLVSVGLAAALIGAGTAAANAASAWGGGYPQTVNAGATSGSVATYVAVPTPDNSAPYAFTASFVFTAPEHTKFGALSDAQYYTVNGNGSSASSPLAGCALSNADTVLTCSAQQFTIPALAPGVPNGTPAIYFRSPKVIANADAPNGTFDTTATINISDPNLTGGTFTSTKTLVAAAPTPMVDPIVGSAAVGAAVISAGAVAFLRRRKLADVGN